MKNLLVILLCLSLQVSIGQDIIDWDGKYQLQFSDFQSPKTKIGDVNQNTINSAIGINFEFEMTSAEFIFTKNFNSKVDCTFDPSESYIVSPDKEKADQLVNFSRFSFDLAELYARKLREKLFENKGLFSNTDFFHPIYDEMNRQYNQRHVLASKETNIGEDKEKLKALHLEVMDEINALSDFCKECKPPKKSKRN